MRKIAVIGLILFAFGIQGALALEVGDVGITTSDTVDDPASKFYGKKIVFECFPRPADCGKFGVLPGTEVKVLEKKTHPILKNKWLKVEVVATGQKGYMCAVSVVAKVQSKTDDQGRIHFSN